MKIREIGRKEQIFGNIPDNCHCPLGLLLHPPLPQLDRAKYPNIVHWFEQLYHAYRKGKQDDKNEPGKPSSSMLSRYMENKDGSEVPELMKKIIRKRARDVFEHLLQEGMASSHWKHATFEVEQFLICVLEAKFPFLRLCENHWKAKMVTTNCYSH